MAAQPITEQRHSTAAWVVATVLASLLIPAVGGFVVTYVSRLDRFRAGSPSLWLLLGVATVVLVLQVLGLQTFPFTQHSSVGPIETAG